MTKEASKVYEDQRFTKAQPILKCLTTNLKNETRRSKICGVVERRTEAGRRRRMKNEEERRQ